MEREYSKTWKVHQTLIINRIHGALILSQFIKNGEDTKPYRKASVTDLDQPHFIL